MRFKKEGIIICILLVFIIIIIIKVNALQANPTCLDVLQYDKTVKVAASSCTNLLSNNNQNITVLARSNSLGNMTVNYTGTTVPAGSTVTNVCVNFTLSTTDTAVANGTGVFLWNQSTSNSYIMGTLATFTLTQINYTYCNSTIVSTAADANKIKVIFLLKGDATNSDDLFRFDYVSVNITYNPNAIPTINQSIIIHNGTLQQNGQLNCTAGAFDNNLNKMNVSFNWYLNNNKQLGFYGNDSDKNNGNLAYAPLNITNASKGNVWICGAYAYDGFQFGNETNSSSVTILNTIPTSPTSLTPNNNTIISTNQTNLTFTNGTDVDNDILRYNIQIATDVAFTNIKHYFANWTANSTSGYTTPKLNTTTYYWRANSYDGVVNSSFSAINNFTMTATAPNTAPIARAIQITDAGGAWTTYLLNPISGSNSSVAIRALVEDTDGCTTANVTAYICNTGLVNSNSCRINSYTYAINLSYAEAGGPNQCYFTFNGSTYGPRFWEANGTWRINTSIVDSGALSSTNLTNFTYNGLLSVNYPSTINLGGNPVTVNQWNTNTTEVNLTNYGNVNLTLNWNVTNPNSTNQLYQWNLNNTDFWIDDDPNVHADVGFGNITEINITSGGGAGPLFRHSNGLTTCVNEICTSPNNSTLGTYYHIAPPIGLAAATYQAVITITVGTFTG